MITIFFYLFILFSSTFFIWFSEKITNKIEKFILNFVSFLIVFIPSAIRYDIGTDYLNYVDIYNNIENYTWIEPGFYFLNIILNELGLSSNGAIAVFSFIFTLISFLCYPRKNAWLIHLCLICTLWFFSFNGIRQAIAIAISILAISKFLQRKYYSFFILILIGSTFHQSIYIIFLSCCISLIPINEKAKYYILPIIFVVIIFVSGLHLEFIFKNIEQTLTMLGMYKYSGYFSSETHFIPRSSGTGLGAALKIAFSIYVILNTKKILQLNHKLWLIIILNLFYAISIVLASNIIIFGRMADIFSIAPILSIYILSLLQKNKTIHYLVLGFFVLFLVLTFVKDGLSIKTDYADPKRNPYQTIFEWSL